ncbi:MAG: hypothetical protein HOG05_14005 [Bacteroidetes bacterium]|nr:hypothetical protein [Bacteroidota bacterium]
MQKLIATKDLDLLKKIGVLFEKEAPIAYNAEGKPLSKKQLYRDLKAAEKEIEKGDYYTIAELREESKSWGQVIRE